MSVSYGTFEHISLDAIKDVTSLDKRGSRGEAARLDAEVAVTRCASTCTATNLTITEQVGMFTKITAGVAAALCRSQKVGASRTFSYSGRKSVSSLNQTVFETKETQSISKGVNHPHTHTPHDSCTHSVDLKQTHTLSDTHTRTVVFSSSLRHIPNTCCGNAPVSP